MQRQAAGKGYFRRAPPLFAISPPFFDSLIRGTERYGARNVLSEGGEDWMLADGGGGEVILNLGRVRTVCAVSLTNPVNMPHRGTNNFHIQVSVDMMR